MSAVLRENAVPNGQDTITILKSAGPVLTKTFDGDKVVPYDEAKHFSCKSVPVSGLRQLADILARIEREPRRCVIRGEFIGDAAAQSVAPPEKPGLYPRKNELYRDVPHHWVMFDIDKYMPIIWCPVENPAEAIEEFIYDQLPAEFHGISFYWQLSSSAGRNPGELKAHIWFWFESSYIGTSLRAWVKRNQLPIDVSPFRQVQVHYTAAPLFVNGAIDPVPVRSGLCEGVCGDEVPLTIPEDIVTLAAEASDSGDVEMPDPREKGGVIGAFCRAFTITETINRFLPDHFLFAPGSDRRVTWLGGGGSPEGAFVTDDDLHLGNTHNTDPLDNRLTNAFDLARWYLFGHLDQDLDLVTDVFTRPSYRAMLEWAETLPEVRSASVVASVATRSGFATAIGAAPDEAALRQTVLPQIRECLTLEKADREHLAKMLQGKWRQLLGTTMRISDARDLVAPERSDRDINMDAPSWARPWVFATDKDKFFNLDSGESVTITGFNMMHDRHMRGFMDENGFIPAASNYCKTEWDIETVAGVGYMPGVGSVFDMLGLRWANSYSDRDIPQVPPVLTDAEQGAVDLVKDHLARLFPDERERGVFTSWLAYNTRAPGGKVRWAPFIYGAEGAGKSFFINLLGMVMGPGNVAPLDAGTVCTSDFSGWAVGAAVRCMEEVKLHGHNAHDVTNKLKQFHTNTIIDVHPKGRDPYRAINKTNYLLLSNYIDGLPLEEGDRRYFVLHCAVSKEEAKALTASGYFEALFAAIETFPGAVRKWLLEFDLHPEFQPDGQAPMTSAKQTTISLSKSNIYIAGEELIENGAEGVTKKAISSNCFTAALRDLTGKDIYSNTVHTLLTNLGYTYFGEIKWRKKKHRVWVRDRKMWADNSDGGSGARAEIRAEFESFDFDFDFLK